MTVEQLIVDRLLSTSAVTALVSTRVYQLKLPQKPTLPSVRVQVISEVKEHHLRGPEGATPTRVQVDAYAADSYDAAVSVAEAVDGALDGQVFDNGSPLALSVLACLRRDRRPIYDADELRLVKMSQDYIVWSKAA